MTFDDLVERAAALVRPGRRATLGIAGSPGAGKTTLAERLVRELNGNAPGQVAQVPMDGFHLADAELDRLGRRDRKGAPDTFDAAGYAALLRRLRDEQDDDIVYAPGFERTLEQPIAGAVPVPRSARLIITEGNYLLLGDGAWARVRSQLDEVWFCELDAQERVRRLVARHEEFGKDHDTAVAWVLGTDQRNADLVAATRDRADLVVGAEVTAAGVPARVPSGIARGIPDPCGERLGVDRQARRSVLEGFLLSRPMGEVRVSDRLTHPRGDGVDGRRRPPRRCPRAVGAVPGPWTGCGASVWRPAGRARPRSRSAVRCSAVRRCRSRPRSGVRRWSGRARRRPRRTSAHR